MKPFASALSKSSTSKSVLPLRVNLSVVLKIVMRRLQLYAESRATAGGAQYGQIDSSILAECINRCRSLDLGDKLAGVRFSLLL